MKTKLISKTGVGKDFDLPKDFSGKIRPDILLKVFEALKVKQGMGSKIGAGAGYSASGIIRHRRHVWKTGYGKGMSRIPRKIFSRSGASFNWQGATVASTRGGRRAHPPRSSENQFKKINKKEMKIAVASALTGTIDAGVLEKKYGKKVESGFIASGDILSLKTKEFKVILDKLFDDVRIWKEKSVRAGKGKLRGRKYKSNAGLLFVIGNEEKMNRKGIDVVHVGDLEIKDLAPNGVAGRFACYSEKAIEEIAKDGGKDE